MLPAVRCREVAVGAVRISFKEWKNWEWPGEDPWLHFGAYKSGGGGKGIEIQDKFNVNRFVMLARVPFCLQALGNFEPPKPNDIIKNGILCIQMWHT